MSVCHDLFIDFHSEIFLTSDKKESLRTSRNAVREKIKKHFRDKLKLEEPKFYGQGSYMMNTTVVPIDGEFDIDDGIYLQNLEGVEEKDWPIPTTVHNWILDAVNGHTSSSPVDKNTCVRVIYKANYHVDLPIYVMSGSHPKLAHKSKGWIDSDPKELTKWFNGEATSKGAQLKRIVRYLKAWKDYKEGETKLPSGMILSILAINHFVSDYKDNDDKALVETVRAIKEALDTSFSLVRPVFPSEELINDWSETKKTNFLDKLDSLIKKGDEALTSSDKTSASKKWRGIFGDRFPEYQAPDSETSAAFRSTSPAILGNHGRSA
ncbi:CBASS cGAMP synthase [Paenibacillus sp. KS-LC4]|uniref:CBASS cGAMP synthase n=1 Tax=Paenibacillus sp. KS-LC4 TaxID=2979727 RepID=UPI0030D0AB32